MAVLIFWVLTGAVLAFVALAVYGARLAERDPKTTPYGRAVAARYERSIDRVVEERVSAAMESIRGECYIVPKARR